MSYGIEVFSQNGTKVFGSDFRTSNLQHTISLNLGPNATSSTFSMADANDSTKVVVTIISADRLIPGMFTINTSSTGFSITNNRNATNSCIGLAFRIG